MNKKEKKEDSNWRDSLLKFSMTVKAVVVRGDEKVLLLKRTKKEHSNKGKFDLPGGYIEKGETFQEAVVREIKEETGLDAAVESIIKTSEYEKGHELFDNTKALRFIARVQDGEVELNKEHSEFEWLSIDEAIEKMNTKNGFEQEKRETLIAAKRYLEMKNADEIQQRTLADFENFKKRTEKSNEEFRKYCLESSIHELLPVIDNFEMATAHVPEGQESDPWVVGILHIQNQLLKFLEDNGVKEISAKEGDEIDENIHDVISGKAKKGKGKIAKVLKKGFTLNEKVIRPVSVEAK